MNRTRKDLLGMSQLSAAEITEIIDVAANMRKVLDSGNKKTAYLQGKTVVNLFYENSTRTRLSFELAAKYLGANTANITASASSVSKGENLADTGQTIEHMAADFLVIRHPQSGAADFLGRRISSSVINAGDGMHEHPTQSLLDLYTIQEKLGRLEGLKVAIIGDVSHSRVARSNLWALQKLGSEVRLAGPRTMLPPGIEQSGAGIFHSVREACEGADVVMALRIQLERQQSGLFPSIAEYSQVYGVNDELMKLTKPGALLMHPGPANHGVEITSSVYRSTQSVIAEQVTNGVAVRMAVLYLLNLRRND